MPRGGVRAGAGRKRKGDESTAKRFTPKLPSAARRLRLFSVVKQDPDLVRVLRNRGICIKDAFRVVTRKGGGGVRANAGRPAKWGKDVEVSCEACGDLFVTALSRQNQKRFCSTRCRASAKPKTNQRIRIGARPGEVGSPERKAYDASWRQRRLLAKYGATVEEFERDLRRLDSKCPLCLSVFDKFCVDHDHETGHYRGPLCARCNGALGMFDDDIDRLRRAVVYLDSFAGKKEAC